MKASDTDKAELKEIRQQLSQKIEDSLPEDFKRRHDDSHGELPDLEAMEVDLPMAKRIIEAFLFSVSRAIQINEFQRILKGYKASQVSNLINELQEEYVRDGRSFRINQVATGYEVVTLPEYYPWLKRAEVSKKSKVATTSALETLAVIAYKQPITRGEVEAIRGVDASGALSTLLERNFLRIVGRKQVPGRPLLYGTTALFLEHFGLKSLDDLPRINEIKEIVSVSVQQRVKLEQEEMEVEQMKREEERTKEQIIQDGFEQEHAVVREKFREIADHIERIHVLKEKEFSQVLQSCEGQNKASLKEDTEIK